MIIGVLVIGVLLISFVVYMEHLKSKCTLKITGKFLRANSYSGSRSLVVRYAPVFQYNFNNTVIEKQTFQSFSKKYIKNNFSSGENYTIYINKDNPKCFIVEKKFQMDNLLLILLGLFFILCGSLGLLSLLML